MTICAGVKLFDQGAAIRSQFVELLPFVEKLQFVPTGNPPDHPKAVTSAGHEAPLHCVADEGNAVQVVVD